MSDNADASQVPTAAVLFYLIAVGLAGWGVFTMFAYSPDPLGAGWGQIVGGDAYNFQIIATRGVGFVAAGIVSALIGLSVQVHQLLHAIEGALLE